VGQHQWVVAPDQAGGDPGFHVRKRVGDRLFLAFADHGCKALFGAGEFQEHEQVAICVEPFHRGPDTGFDPAHRVWLVGDGLTLRTPEISLGVQQDLTEQLFLGREVPVEDALSHPEAIDDLRDGRGVVAARREQPCGKIDQLPPAPLSSFGQPPCHATTLQVDQPKVKSYASTPGETSILSTAA